MLKKLKVISEIKNLEYQTSGAAGIDLPCLTDEDIVINPGKTERINTGVKVQIPEGFFGAVYPRSSTGVKKSLMLANTVGVIDSDYRGEIVIFLYNYGQEKQIIKNGDRLAQLIIQPYQRCDIEFVEELSQSVRGEDGFGSTGQ